MITGKSIRAIEDDNNEEPIKQRLAVMHRIFCDAISRNLGIAYDPELPLFRGQIFTGDVAVANGYIDQFGTLEDAVKWVLAQATVRKVNAMYNI